MNNFRVIRAISKGNDVYCRLVINISQNGQVFFGELLVTDVVGNSVVISVSAVDWNSEKIYCKLINGEPGILSKLSYAIESNFICLYIHKSEYSAIRFVPFSEEFNSYLEVVSSIPSYTTNIVFK